MKGPHSNDEPLVKAMDSCGHAFGHKVFLFEKLEVTASLRTILVHVSWENAPYLLDKAALYFPNAFQRLSN